MFADFMTVMPDALAIESSGKRTDTIHRTRFRPHLESSGTPSTYSGISPPAPIPRPPTMTSIIAERGKEYDVQASYGEFPPAAAYFDYSRYVVLMELIINATNGSFSFQLPESHTVRFSENGRGIAIVLHLGKQKVVELKLDHDIDRARVTNGHGRTVIDWPLELPEHLQSELTGLSLA